MFPLVQDAVGQEVDSGNKNAGGDECPNVLTDSESECEDTHAGRAKKLNNHAIRKRRWDNALRNIGQARIDLDTEIAGGNI